MTTSSECVSLFFFLIKKKQRTGAGAVDIELAVHLHLELVQVAVHERPHAQHARVVGHGHLNDLPVARGQRVTLAGEESADVARRAQRQTREPGQPPPLAILQRRPSKKKKKKEKEKKN